MLATPPFLSLSMMNKILKSLGELFSPAAMSTYLAELVPKLIVAIIAFLVIYLVWLVIDRLMAAGFRRAQADTTMTSFVRTVTKYLLLAAAVITALGQLGINTASILASLGIVGLTIGFAARDALSNLISGIFIFWDRPFVIGDLVDIEGHYGEVDRITLRSTRVVTPDGKMLAIPNTTVVNSVVASYTNFPHLRLGIEVTISVDENIDRVRELLVEMALQEPDLLTNRTPQVVTTALNDYNVALELRVWIKNEKEHIARRFDLREKVYKLLTDAGVDMPFETVNVRQYQPQAA